MKPGEAVQKALEHAAAFPTQGVQTNQQFERAHG